MGPHVQSRRSAIGYREPLRSDDIGWCKWANQFGNINKNFALKFKCYFLFMFISMIFNFCVQVSIAYCTPFNNFVSVKCTVWHFQNNAKEIFFSELQNRNVVIDTQWTDVVKSFSAPINHKDYKLDSYLCTNTWSC